MNAPRWFRGPWTWDASDKNMPHWRPPVGCLGALDLRSIPDQSQAGGTPGLGVFVLPTGTKLASEFDALGDGSHRDIKVSQKLLDSLPKRKKFKVEGDDLLGNLWSILTLGADPDGDEFAKPLMPGVDGTLSLHIAGQSHFERFQWGRSKEMPAIKQMLRKEFAGLLADARGGKLRDSEQHRRVLDYWCDKYRVDDWREFVPTALQSEVPGRLKHETTITDNFNRADSTGLGASWSSMQNSGFDVSSNQARGTNAASNGTRSRFNSDLSSSDNYVQMGVVSFGSIAAANNGVLARCSGSADTCYAWLLRNATAYRRLFKIVSGSATVLSSDTTFPASPVTVKLLCDGSSIKVYYAGSEVTGLATTDTAIATGLRGGMQGQQSSTVGDRTIADDFISADLAVSGILYTQLESTTRGLNRGLWARR